MQQVNLRDANGSPLFADAPAGQIAETVYEIPIRRGLRFQPHPAGALPPGGVSSAAS